MTQDARLVEARKVIEYLLRGPYQGRSVWAATYACVYLEHAVTRAQDGTGPCICGKVVHHADPR